MASSGAYGACRACAGIVGDADLLLGGRVQRVLEAHVAAAPERFRGVRHLTHWHPDPSARSTGNTAPGLLLHPAFREGVACLAPLELSLDVWLYATQLQDACDLAGAFPDTTIVLDHIGGPLGLGPYAGKRDEVFAEWSAGIAALARHGNVHVKLGGLGMRVFGFAFHEQPRPPTSEQLAMAWRPYIETCVEAFGPRRCMFESNAPVDKGTCSYHVLWNAFKRISAGCSPRDRHELFCGTAARVYRIADLPGSPDQPV
jgi:L-fuconolactonase